MYTSDTKILDFLPLRETTSILDLLIWEFPRPSGFVDPQPLSQCYELHDQ